MSRKNITYFVEEQGKRWDPGNGRKMMDVEGKEQRST